MNRATFRGAVLTIMVVMVVGCSASTGTPSPSTTPIALPAEFPLGSWVVTITEQDLHDGGVTEPQIVRENVGTFTKMYAADGTWTAVQEAPSAVGMPVFRGTFRATGPNEIEERTTFPSQYTGDLTRLTWSREGNAIRFTVIDPADPMIQIVTATHLWQPK
jgi:hypothetical protein